MLERSCHCCRLFCMDTGSFLCLAISPVLAMVGIVGVVLVGILWMYLAMLVCTWTECLLMGSLVVMGGCLVINILQIIVFKCCFKTDCSPEAPEGVEQHGDNSVDIFLVCRNTSLIILTIAMGGFLMTFFSFLVNVMWLNLWELNLTHMWSRVWKADWTLMSAAPLFFLLFLVEIVLTTLVVLGCVELVSCRYCRRLWKASAPATFKPTEHTSLMSDSVGKSEEVSQVPEYSPLGSVTVVPPDGGLHSSRNSPSPHAARGNQDLLYRLSAV